MGTMRPRELFGVAVRILAVWFWTQAAYWGYWGAVKSISTGMGNPAVSVREDVGYMILYGLIGVFLMSGARALVWLANGDDPTLPANADNAGITRASTMLGHRQPAKAMCMKREVRFCRWRGPLGVRCSQCGLAQQQTNTKKA